MPSPNRRIHPISLRATFDCSLVWKLASMGHEIEYNGWIRENSKISLRRCFDQFYDLWSTCLRMLKDPTLKVILYALLPYALAWPPFRELFDWLSQYSVCKYELFTVAWIPEGCRTYRKLLMITCRPTSPEGVTRAFLLAESVTFLCAAGVELLNGLIKKREVSWDSPGQIWESFRKKSKYLLAGDGKREA
jgi:hypothetical protein